MTEFDREKEDALADVARSRRAAKRTMQLLVLVALLLAAAVAVASWLATQNAELAAENGSFAAQQQGEKKEIAKEAGRALCGQGDREIYDRELCAKWAEAAQEPTIPTEAPAPPLGGPSQIDLVNAFRDYCADGNCKGQDGQPPTPDDIAAAFVKFCADGRCVGPAGKDAVDGVDGQSPGPDMVLAAVSNYCSAGACIGPAGADGPPPTPEAILAAVQQQCADGSCQGDKGDKGDKGDPPTSITYTDGPMAGYTCTPDPPGSTTYTCTMAPVTPAPATGPKQ